MRRLAMLAALVLLLVLAFAVSAEAHHKCGHQGKVCPPSPPPASSPPETTISQWVDNDSTNPIDEDGNGTETTQLHYTVQNADGAQYSLNGGAWTSAGASPALITVPANGLESTVQLRATRSSDGAVDSTPATSTITMCPQAGCSTQPPSGGVNVLVGAGDIASGYNQNDEATAKLLDGIGGTVYTTGDNVYESGTASEYSSYYEPTWGRHKARTKPTPGNHEYNTSGASGYFGYFSVPSYYSYSVGDWQILALDSNVSIAAGSAQYEWLKGELANSNAACTVAYFHHPLFSSGQHGNNTFVKPLWDLLYADGADLVLNGHDHTYERFAPQNASGQADARGIREFVVGTGGRSLYAFGTVKANSENRLNDRYGVLKLTLNSGSYVWEFVDTAGTVADSGTGQCVT